MKATRPLQLTMLDRELHTAAQHYIMDFFRVEVALTLQRKTKDQESLFEKDLR